MPTVSWRPSNGVAYLLLSSLCSPSLWAVESFPDKPTSVPTSRQSRNKKGRITNNNEALLVQQVLLGCRGGSQKSISTAAEERRRRRRDRELDEYIDFLIAKYCPEEAEDETIFNNNTEATTRCSRAQTLRRKEDQRIHTEQQPPQNEYPEEEEATFHVETTIESYNNGEILEESSRLLDRTVSGGGDDDDDDQNSEAEEAELLDRYIEFLQDDFENDQALDKYIDFVQQDYEDDQALDSYIDFLLATTTASIPNRVADDNDVTIETTLLPTHADEVVVLSTADSPKKETGQHQKLLDAYISRLVTDVESEDHLDAYVDRLAAAVDGIVTAVELDQYIDNMVESVSEARQEQVEEATQPPLVETVVTEAQEMEEEDEKEEIPADILALDSYIDFVQQDYEDDRALDKYIDFVQQNYEDDQALDSYIDFLVATTTASVPNRVTTESGNVTIETTVLPPEADEVVVLPKTDFPRNETEMQHQRLLDAYINRLVTDIESKEEQQQLLDAYIDQLVTAVELDEYIDSLLASMSGAHQEDQVPQKEVPAVAIDDYIETMVSVKREDTKEAQSISANNEKQFSSQVVGEKESIATVPTGRDEEDTVESSVIESFTELTDDETSKVSLEAVSAASEESSAPEKPALKTKKKRKTQRKKEKLTTAATPVVTRASSSSEIDNDTSTALESDQPETATEETKIAVNARDNVSTSFGGDDDDDGDNNDNNQQPSLDGELEEAKDPSTVEPTPKKKRKKKTKALKTAAEEAEKQEDEEPVAATTDEKPEGVKVAEGEHEVEEDESQETAPIQSPNGLYRFLLSKGAIGHIIVLAIVLLVEWIQLYVPQLAELLAVMWTKLAPTGLQRRMAPQQYVKGGEGSSSAHLQHLYSGRMPVKGKEGKKLKKQIDQEALDLLKSIGDVQDAKYKHVSVGFLQRHGLGPYRDDMADVATHDDIVRPSSRKRAKGSKRKPRLQDDDDDASDVDWVVEGLSDDKSIAGKAKPPLDTSLSFGVGPKGPVAEVGIEFGLGGSSGGGKRKSTRKKIKALDVDAIARDNTRKKKSGPRPSDREGGGGVLGRLRAAATSNNLMSRSLLGAYPGDAAPVGETADASGVAALASKYGYGDWSEDDESDDGNMHRKSKQSRRKKSKRRTKKGGGMEEGEDYGLGDFLSAAKEDQLGSLMSASEPDDDDLLLKPSRKTRKTRSKTIKGKSSANGTKASLDPLKATRKIRKKHKKKSSSNSGSGIEKLAKKADDATKQKSVRPALARLNEIKKKGQNDPTEEK